MAGETGIEGEAAAFNFALNYLKRIDTLLHFCNEAARQEDAQEWYKILTILFRELRNETLTLKRGDKKMVDILDDLHNTLSKSYHQYMTGLKRYLFTIDKFPKFQGREFIPPNDLMKLLHEFELRLREVIKDKGMQMPRKADARFAVR